MFLCGVERCTVWCRETLSVTHMSRFPSLFRLLFLVFVLLLWLFFGAGAVERRPDLSVVKNNVAKVIPDPVARCRAAFVIAR